MNVCGSLRTVAVSEPPRAGPEIERVLDHGAEPGGLDRKRIVSLIARRISGAVVGRGMVMLVIGQLLAGFEIALGDATRIRVDRRHPGEDRARCIEADILDHQISDRVRRRHDRLRGCGPGETERRRNDRRDEEHGGEAQLAEWLHRLKGHQPPKRLRIKSRFVVSALAPPVPVRKGRPAWNRMARI